MTQEDDELHMSDDQPDVESDVVPTEEVEENPEDIEEDMIKKTNKPKTLGALITVFVAVVVIMIGGLASYYYYTFQSEGSANQQSVRNSWNEVVLATINLTNSFNLVENYDDLILEDKNSFSSSLGDANRSLRDIFYGLQGSQSYVFSGNTFASRLNTFLDDYLAYLRQMQRLIDRGTAGVLEDMSEAEELDNLENKIDESYDNLLVSDKDKVIEANLPRELFEMNEEIRLMVEEFLEDKQTKTDKEDELKSAAAFVVTKFMQAYIDRDAEAMKVYLTPEAQAEFNPAVTLEDLSEIKSFKILDNRKTGDTKIEINAKINKETPDAKSFSEDRLFVLLFRDDDWLIDSWAK